MSSLLKGVHASKKVHIEYQLIRNVTSPEEKSNGVQTYFSNIPAEDIVDIPTTDNLRDYIAEHNPRKRNAVHRAIETMILTEPDKFINRNAGLTITCSAMEFDDKKREMALADPSVINGAQTQGEIRRFLESISDEDDEFWPEADFHVRVEIIIDPEHSSIVETAIARNSATKVQSISQAGARGHLDELDNVMRKATGKGIRTSETQLDVHDTFHVLRCARLLMPEDITGKKNNSEILKPYMNKAKCLEEFSSWYENRKSDPVSKRKYDFTINIAPLAIKEYEAWEKSSHWVGHRIWEDTQKGGRACKRDEHGNIVWMSPGIMYPLVGAMSAFVSQDSNGNWHLPKPAQFKPNSMIEKTVKVFRDLDSKPMLMGRNLLAYSNLSEYPSMLLDLLKDISE